MPSNNQNPDQIVAILLRVGWDDEEEVLIIVEHTLTVDSRMEIIMKEGDIFSELGASGTKDGRKFQI